MRRQLLRILPKLKNLFYQQYNLLYMWMSGVEYGHHIKVFDKIRIFNRGHICIGDDFTFTSGNFFNPISRNIGGSLFTQSKSSVIEIGDHVGISSTCLWAKEKISIGNHVTIGADCVIMDTDVHPQDYMQRRDSDFSAVASSPIVIEDDVWIGARCIILKGVHIGTGSIVGAGSVVTKSIPQRVIAAGNPCKVIRPVNG